ncbi:MAG: glycosyltransferase family 2 protein [Isosphaeraceae bacterium]
MSILSDVSWKKSRIRLDTDASAQPRRCGLDRTSIACPGEQIGSGQVSFLSVIIPARNEAASLGELVYEVWSTCHKLCNRETEPGERSIGGFEIIVVDDGSTDATPWVLEQLTDQFPEFRPLCLRTNAGQSGATIAGLRAAQGDLVATLDADLQNDPADLAALWEALPGYDAALGWRVRRADTHLKRIISRSANWFRNWVLGQSIRDTGCSVRLLPRSLMLRLPVFHGVHRFWGPLLLREGCRIVQIPVQHHPRAHGRSHYNIWNRSFSVLVDLLGVIWLMRRPVRYEVHVPGRR